MKFNVPICFFVAAGLFIGWLDVAASQFYDVNEHNGLVPRDL